MMSGQWQQAVSGVVVQLVRIPACHAWVAGSSPSTPPMCLLMFDDCGVVVQLVRIPACHAWVAGSSPVHSAIIKHIPNMRSGSSVG